MAEITASSKRYDKAVRRNLAELQKTLLIRATLVGMEEVESRRHTFNRIVYESLYNDYHAHAMKVLERSSQASSFWYIYRTDERPIREYAAAHGLQISEIEEVARKLKVIRDGTHFHIDSVGVLDPSKIWDEADITGRQLANALDFAWNALSAIAVVRGIAVPDLMNYKPEIARRAVERVETERLGP